MIAAVNGPCAGAGLSLACACDIRIASDAANFVPGFIGIGLIPDSGGSWFVHRLLGFARAFEWMTSNRRLTAAEAHAWGLVSEVVEADNFAARTAEFAAEYAARPTRGDRPDEAPLRARLHGIARRAARARGRAAAGGDRHGRLRRGRRPRSSRSARRASAAPRRPPQFAQCAEPTRRGRSQRAHGATTSRPQPSQRTLPSHREAAERALRPCARGAAAAAGRDSAAASRTRRPSRRTPNSESSSSPSSSGSK